MLKLSNISLFNLLIYAVASDKNNEISKGYKRCVEYGGKININIRSILYLSMNFQLI